MEFTILTACRTNESIGAKWVEFDFDSKIWIIPANRMKAEKEHRVPLTDYTIQLLDTMPKINDFVFPGKGKNGLSNMAMAQVLKRMNRNDITVHGFRSCFRDWAAECTQFHNDILEMCLAHTIKNASEAAYRRGDMIEKRRIVMEQWQKHILSI